MNNILNYSIITVLLLIMELCYFQVADRCNIIDKPNERSSHKCIILRGGGIIFPLAMLVYALFFGIEYVWFLTGLTIISAVSFIDDVRSLPDSVRLLAQFVSMFLMFADFGILNMQSWWIILIALIVCVGIINAYNFMDGINGITGGYSIAILIPLIILNRQIKFIDERFMMVALSGTLVFVFFNFRKRAKCFAGDVGSIAMAFIVLFALGKLILQTADFTYIILLALYGVDSILTIIHRIMLHENLGQAHRKHAYQIMANELHIPHVVVSGIYMVIQLTITAGFIWFPVKHWIYFVMVILLFSVAYIAFMKKYYHLHSEYLAGLKE